MKRARAIAIAQAEQQAQQARLLLTAGLLLLGRMRPAQAVRPRQDLVMRNLLLTEKRIAPKLHAFETM